MELTKNTRIIYHFELQERKCYYCKRELLAENNYLEANIDHKIASSRGGKDTLENTCLSCKECNTAKANLNEDEFLPIMDKIKNGEMKHKDIVEYAKYLQLKRKFEGGDLPTN